MPVALVEKGKQPGSHLLSGAVMNPRAARRLRGQPRPARGDPDLRGGAGRGRLPADAKAGAPDPAPADAAKPRELRRLDLADVPLSRRAGRGRWHVRAARDGGRPAARRPRAHRGDPQRRQGPGQGGGAARELRARRGHQGEGDGARRGNGRAPDRRRTRPLRPSRSGAPDLGARRERGLAGRQAAAQDRPHPRLATSQAREVPGVGRLVALPDG